MTPTEKAKELYDKFYLLAFEYGVEEINTSVFAQKAALEVADSHLYSENDSPFGDTKSWMKNHNFWVEVKKELTENY